MFWKWFSSSISLATVTPSWVTVGGPHSLSFATFLPRGPRVTLTALASASMPVLSCRRASASNTSCFADMFRLLLSVGHDGQQVALSNDQVLVALQLDFRAGILGE